MENVTLPEVRGDEDVEESEVDSGSEEAESISIHGDTDDEDSLGSLADFIVSDSEEPGVDFPDHDYLDDDDDTASTTGVETEGISDRDVESELEQPDDSYNDEVDVALILPEGSRRRRGAPARYCNSGYVSDFEMETESESDNDSEDGEDDSATTVDDDYME